MQKDKKESILTRTYILIKSIVFWILFLINTLVTNTIIIILGLFRLQNTAHRVGFVWGRINRALTGTKVEIRNKEKEYRDGPVILMINHQSLFDIIVIYQALDTQFRWLVKDSLFKIPIFGNAMKGIGYIPVHRGDRRKSMQSIFNAAKKINEGSSILVFPEGTRTKLPHGEMGPFLKGSFLLAKKSKVPIQPITIWGCGEVLPKNEKVKIQRVYSANVKVIFHDIIKSDEYEDMNLNTLSNHVRSIIESPFKELREEIPLKSGLLQRLAEKAEQTKKMIADKTEETKAKIVEKAEQTQKAISNKAEQTKDKIIKKTKDISDKIKKDLTK